MKKITNVINKISSAFSVVSGTVLVAMTILISLDVCWRMFAKAFTFSFELTQIGMMILTYFSFAYTQTKHGHIHVTMLVRLFPKKVKYLVFGLLYAVSAATVFLVSYRGFIQTMLNKNNHIKTSVLLWPMYPFQFICNIAMLLFAVTLIWDAVKMIGAIFSTELDEEVKDIIV